MRTTGSAKKKSTTSHTGNGTDDKVSHPSKRQKKDKKSSSSNSTSASTDRNNQSENGTIKIHSASTTAMMKNYNDADDVNNNNSTQTTTNKKEKSIFFVKQVDFTVSLYPSSLRNCHVAIGDSLKDLLLKYVTGLDGVLMAFDNVQLKTDNDDDDDDDGTGHGMKKFKNNKNQGKGWIFNELPHIHYNATVRALVFSPGIGCNLEGTVVECFPSHVSLLVLNYFNAMIPAEKLNSVGYVYDEGVQQWMLQQEDSQTITIGDKMTFVVDKLYECGGTISLEGKDPSVKLVVET